MDSRRLRSFSLTAVVALLGTTLAAAPVSAGAPPPANDNFLHAAAVGSLPATLYANSTNATTETDEPTSVCAGNAFTVWYDLVVPADTYVLLDAADSDFDADLSVWRGSSLGNLREIACSYGTGQGGSIDPGRVTFLAKAGTHYAIQVNGAYDEDINDDRGGHLVLTARQVSPPPNDDFANAQEISPPFDATFRNVKATTQFGEPAFGPCFDMRATRWYRVYSAKTRNMRADTFGTPFDTEVAIFDGGPGLGDLDYVGCDDDTYWAGSNTTNSSVTWRARAGHWYWIQVGGYDNETGAIHFRLRKVKAPDNDDRANATVIAANLGGGYEADVNTRGATWQKTETVPQTCTEEFENLNLQSVWFRWTPDATDTVEVDPTYPSGVDGVAIVYRGDWFGSQEYLACSSTAAVWSAQPGITYWIQIVATDGRSGPIHIRVVHAA